MTTTYKFGAVPLKFDPATGHMLPDPEGPEVIRSRGNETASIPRSSDNRDYAEFLDWLEDGGVPDPDVAPVATVPTLVTPAQAKVALYNAGMLDAVEAAIATSYRPIRIYWDSASVFDRNHPYILGIGALLGLSDAQMDALFLAASIL